MSPSLNSIRALVIDVDGVLWHGTHALPGVPTFFEFLRAQHIQFVIATNNSARPGSEIIERMAHMGVAINASEVLTSAEATALYLPRLAPRGARVFIIGGIGLATALTNAGYELVEQNADVVIAGIDWTLTYEKLKRAALEIRRGAKFIGTNGDKTYPGEEGIIPGAGSILAALEAATDLAPIVIGKPERPMFDLAIERMNVSPHSAAILGDRLDTDIAGGQRAGLASILVLTGVTTRATLAQFTITPSFIFDDLVALRTEWARAY